MLLRSSPLPLALLTALATLQQPANVQFHTAYYGTIDPFDALAEALLTFLHHFTN